MAKKNSLLDLLNNLRNGVLGTDTNKIDYFIDKKFDEIDVRNDKLNRNLYIDAIKDVTSQKNIDSDELFENILDANINIHALDDTNRLQRYAEYCSIAAKIPHVKRALKVLTDNIISPDNINKQTLDVYMLADADKEKFNPIVSEFETIKNTLKIDDKLWDIVFNVLHKGDDFIEIIHSPKGELSYIILNEEERASLNSEKIEIDVSDISETLSEDDKKLLKENDIVLPKQIIIDGFKSKKILTEDDKEQNKFKSKFSKKDNHRNKDDENIELKDLFLTKHRPEYVVRLESERFRSNLGYLVFPKVETNQNNTNMFANYTNNNANMAMNGNLGFIKGDLGTGLQKPIDSLCKSIIDNLYERIENKEIKIKKNKDLKDAIMKYLLVIKNDEDLKIRYVSPEMMVHFRIDVNKFDPYGESVLDSIVFECKMYIALKTAMAIKQLNSSTDRRILSVEVGLSRNAKNVIEQIKEKMRKRKISIDNLGTIDSIPSQIKTFEDIYLPMLDGKKYIEFDNRDINGSGGQDDVDRLKFMRDNIIGNLMVPPAHVGIEENTSNRALLSQESAIFARTIIGFQKQLSPCFKELLVKLYWLLNDDARDEDMSEVIVTFPAPKTASFEHENEFLEQIRNLTQAYAELGIPKEYLKKKYLTNVDWDMIDKMSTEEKIDTMINNPSQDPNAVGGMGGTGGYGGGF